MRTTIFLTLLFSFVFATMGATSVAGETLYSQPFHTAGSFYHSSRWDPDGSDWDQYVWDAFVLPRNGAITEIRWRGTFDPTYGGSGGPVRNFRIEFCGSVAANSEPNVVDPPLKRYYTGGDASQTPVGTVGGVAMYEYSVTLSVPFNAAAGIKYWVQIEAFQWGVPDWSLARGTGGDGYHYRGIAGSPRPDLYYQPISGDIAFTLNGISSGPASFDFDGDGRTDVSVYRPSTGTWYLNNSQTGAFAMQFGISTDRITPADLDGDGKTDIAVFRRSDGHWYIYKSSTLTYKIIQFGIAEDIPVPSDYDGDGTADIAIFRPSTGTWWVDQSTAGITSVQFGINEDIPAPGDYDGDGTDDFVVYRPSTGIWYGRMSATGDVGVQFGVSTDRIVPGDYDVDGKTDLAVYRPSSGTWYIRNSSNGLYQIKNFGRIDDIPVAGDYDGDGKADVAVFRPSTGVWWLNRSTAGVIAVQYGTSGDVASPSAFGN